MGLVETCLLGVGVKRHICWDQYCTSYKEQATILESTKGAVIKVVAPLVTEGTGKAVRSTVSNTSGSGLSTTLERCTTLSRTLPLKLALEPL